MNIFRKTLALCFRNIYIIGSEAGKSRRTQHYQRTKKMKFIPCKYRYQAIKQMPDCCVIKKVYGGYAGFETITDYEIWKNQK